MMAFAVYQPLEVSPWFVLVVIYVVCAVWGARILWRARRDCKRAEKRRDELVGMLALVIATFGSAPNGNRRRIEAPKNKSAEMRRMPYMRWSTEGDVCTMEILTAEELNAPNTHDR